MKNYFECEVCGKIYDTKDEAEQCEKSCIEKKAKKSTFFKDREKAFEEVRAAFQKASDLRDKFEKDYSVETLISLNGKYYADGAEIDKGIFDKMMAYFF